VKKSAWDLTIAVDADRWNEFAHLRTGDTAMPASTTLPLITTMVMIGRVSRSQNISPDVDLRVLTHDPAVSAKHARMDLHDDGWKIVDLASDNGTNCNGVELVANTPGPFVSGDVLQIGAWSTVTLIERS
jgi:pSer/pThr/pTyr-binding forkhead associated (FHA) protein